MFALLVQLHKVGDIAVTQFLSTSTQIESAGDTESLDVAGSIPTISPELMAKEKDKAKQGFCETGLWNCTDLWGP
ncbi:hypothetical protein GUITHDRAFT_109916 [Guillardia theta CCMP2712]|uniref:Uncharacterized protein n=1 Tax=Guillardia theta (strain CCMP2712) TaxID=905079 RepID=L1J6G5_GUITC|nr:hypothetical protein GUITHDRAFT_109916 [Guillardia theta CCMP2712]EKX44133.1 hypothetical protein GUITHDRAFT_109916 [Guillardia theta CCMP2712]|eukprot:XP_005831113.1 hypothetical protein GUITHDRAFT_109916 [Guillardia theta CCMP2712]